MDVYSTLPTYSTLPPNTNVPVYPTYNPIVVPQTKKGISVWIIAIICIILVIVIYFIYAWLSGKGTQEEEASNPQNATTTLKEGWSYIKDNANGLCLTRSLTNEPTFTDCGNEITQLWQLTPEGNLKTNSNNLCLYPNSDAVDGSSLTIRSCEDKGYWDTQPYVGNLSKVHLIDTRAKTCLDQLKKTPITGIMNTCSSELSQYYNVTPQSS